MLIVDELRQHITTSLGDEALERLLRAAYEAIEQRVGPSGEVSEIRSRPAGDLLLLSRPAQDVTDVQEGTQELFADDYELLFGGELLLRLATGSHPGRRWRDRVSVRYIPINDEDERDRVAIELVKFDSQSSPGLVSQSIGASHETYMAPGLPGYHEQREAILGSLTSGVWIR